MKKSFEQMKAQTKAVELHQKLKGREGALGNFGYQELNYKEIIQALSGPQPGEHWLFYKKYLEDLRAMRREERKKYRQAGKSFKEPTIDALAEKLSFGSLRLKQLERLQQDNGLGQVTRIFTDEQVLEASKDQAAFKRTIDDVLAKRPETIFKILTNLPNLIPVEQAKQLVLKEIKDSSHVGLGELDACVGIFSPGEVRQIITEAITDKKLDPFSLFSYKDYKKYLPKDEVTILLKNDLLTQDYVYFYDFEKYIADGYLTFEDQTAYIMTKLSQTEINNDFISKLSEQNMAEMVYNKLAAEDLQKIGGLLVKYFSGDPAGLYHLPAFVRMNLTSHEQAVDIVRQCIKNEKFPLWNLDTALKFLAADEIQPLLARAITANPDEIIRNFRTYSKYMTAEQATTAIMEAVSSRPTVVAENSDLINEHIKDPDVRQKLLNQVIGSISPNAFCRNADELFEALKISDATEQKTMITKKLFEEPSFEYLSNSKIVSRFSPQEIEEIVAKQLELGLGNMLENLESVRQVVGGDKELKKIILDGVDKDPSGFFTGIEKIQYLFSTADFEFLIKRATKTPQGIHSGIFGFDKWVPLVNPEFTADFLRESSPYSVEFLFYQIGKFWNYLPEAERRDFYLKLIEYQPLLALDNEKQLATKLPDISRKKIIEIAYQSENMAFAPKSLDEIFQQLDKETDDETRINLIGQGAHIHLAISQIKKNNLSQSYLKLLNQESLGVKREAELLSTFECLSMLKENNPKLGAQLDKIENQEAAQKIIFKELAALTGLKEKISDQQIVSFSRAMESPVPFTIYFLQYKDSPEHAQILKEIFLSLLDGNFSDWKYGELEVQKAHNYLPHNLTPEQYQAWQQDDSLTLFESLALSTHEAAVAIRQEIVNNAFHFKIEGLEDQELAVDLLPDIAKEAVVIGQELAKTNKAIAELKKSGQAESDQMKELLVSRDQLQANRQMLLTIRSLVRLANLNPEEVASGYLLEGKDKKKKGETLKQVLTGIRRGTAAEGAFVLDNIERKLAGFRSQNQSKQNLICTDSGTAEDFLLVGARPVNSCQHYADGGYNDCLLGYSGPEVKILMLKNEKDKPVARAIFRILSDEKGNPCLHVEHIYSASMNSGVYRSIYSQALKKAEALGIPLFVSAVDVEEMTEGKDNQLAKAFNFRSSDTVLYSQIIRAPKIYVDSAGGAKSFGKYQLSRLRQVEKIEAEEPKS